MLSARLNAAQAAGSLPRPARPCPLRSHRQAVLPPVRSAGEGPGRETAACSDLANLVEAINFNNAQVPAASTSAAPTNSATSPAAASGSGASQPLGPPSSSAGPPGSGSQAGAGGGKGSEAARGSAYYAGLLTSDLKQDNSATGADMLSRSLALAGGVAAFLAFLTLGFMASNGLLG